MLKRLPDLVFDDDGLLVGPGESLGFTKEGVFAGGHFVRFNPLLSDLMMSGGFLEDLLACRDSTLSTHFGLAIDRDVLLDRSLHRSIITKAFIRGPKGISIAKLHDYAFPEDPRGTVTEHVRTANNPVDDLYPLVKLQVMWSRRDSKKTVQIEELTNPQPGTFFRHESMIANKYIHAQWDCSLERFSHFDGAVRLYARSDYNRRLAMDLKGGPKGSGYMKLFRLDGNITLDTWCNLTAGFFKDNELVYEYLDKP